MPVALALAMLGTPPVLAEKPSQVPPSTKSQSADPFVDLFFATCVRHFGKPAILRAELERREATEMNWREARSYLGRAPGAAWKLRFDGSDYIIAVRHDSVCATIATDGDTARMEAQFTEIASKAPEPIRVELAQDSTTPSGDGKLHTLSYAWVTPGRAERMLYTLSTRDAKSSGMRAMATVGLVAR